MSDDNQDTKDDKGGPGVVGVTAGVAGGVGLGLLATKTLVDRNVNYNIAKEYSDAVHDYAQNLNAGSLLNDKPIIDNVHTEFNDMRHSAHQDVLASDKEILQDLRTEGTLLGDARKAANAATPTAEAAAAKQAVGKGMFDSWQAEANKIAGMPHTEQGAAADKLLKTVIEDAERLDRINIAEKVKQIPWTKRINPFNKGLHLTPGQRNMAIVAGTATCAAGAYVIAKASQWIGNGDKGPEK